jgi:cell wall-associated NlpC family hydrolase
MPIIAVRRTSTLSALIFLLLLGTSGTIAAPQTSDLAAATDALAAVKARVAPDARVAVFGLKVERAGDALVLSGEVESAAVKDAALEALRACGERNVVDRAAVLPDPALGDRTSGLVRVSVANVRGRPSHSAELVTQTLMGWPVRVLKEQNGWFLVHTEPDGYLGWIETLQLERVTPAAAGAWAHAARVVSTVPAGVLRAAPSPGAEPVTDLVIGAVMKVGGTTNGWSEAALPDGRRGFAPAGELRDYAAWAASRSKDPDAVDRTARLFLGVPYLWGGTSAKGFDCSGFAKIVMHLHGVELPRDTDQQAAMGQAVPIDKGLSELRKGDLLFFGPGPEPENPVRITHVGIYEGNLEFIHASGLVRRSSFDPASPIYSESLLKRLRAARRVLTADR